MEPFALHVIRTRWENVARTARARRLLDDLASVEPVVSELHVADLADLVGTTSGQIGSLDPAEVHAVLAALVRQFHLDELVGITIVRAILPGLAGVARRMRWGAGGPWSDHDEFAADLVVSAWTRVHEHAGETLARPAQTILDRVHRSLRTQRERHRRDASRARPWDERDCEPTAAASDALSELAFGLDLVRGTLVTAEDANLILANRVHGYRLAELSIATGRSVAQLSYQRRRAESALLR
jgi:hypothetical protein